MAYAKDLVFDVSYNEKKDRLEFKKKKSKIKAFLDKHGIVSITVAFTLLFVAIDVVLMYQFVWLLSKL